MYIMCTLCTCTCTCTCTLLFVVMTYSPPGINIAILLPNIN